MMVISCLIVSVQPLSLSVFVVGAVAGSVSGREVPLGGVTP